MGIDIELFIPIEKNKGKEINIIENILKARGIITYEIKGGNIDIQYPAPCCDHSSFETKEKHDAILNDYKRPESIAVSRYNIHGFAVRAGFMRAGVLDRWKSFFIHKANREHTLTDSLEVARHFSSKFYLVPDESGFYDFPSLSETAKKQFELALTHPCLITVNIPSEILYKNIPLEYAIKKLYFKANKKLMKHIENYKQ